MSTTNTGTAREVAPGRLAHFEDSEDLSEDFQPPKIALPPRRPRGAPTGIDAKTTGVQREQPGPPATGARADTAAQAPQDAAPRRDKGLKGPQDRVRPSNVHIPVALLEPLTRRCRAEGLSHGEVIISSIEAAHSQLPDLIHPMATTGGSLFATRRSRASRAADGPLTPLNYRLREGDYATLDDLVEQFGASSRGHLITVSLLHVFRDELST